MKQYIFLLLMLSISMSVFGQQTDSLIRLRHGIFGLRFYLQDRKMNMSDVADVMWSNQEAYRYIKSARINKTVAHVTALASNVMLFVMLSDLYIFSQSRPGLYATGAAASITSLILLLRSKNQAERAVEVYNEGIRKTGNKPALRLGFHGTGISLAVNF